MEVAYQPEKLYARYQHQVDFTYANRMPLPSTAEQRTWANIKRGLIMLRQDFLEGRRARRLPESVLEICVVAACGAAISRV